MLFRLLRLVYIVISLYAGFCGLHHVGLAWLIVGTILLFFRFTLPYTIGTYICAHTLWHWSWFWSLAFALPGLLFLIPVFAVAAGAGALALGGGLLALIAAPFKAINRLENRLNKK